MTKYDKICLICQFREIPDEIQEAEDGAKVNIVAEDEAALGRSQSLVLITILSFGHKP